MTNPQETPSDPTNGGSTPEHRSYVPSESNPPELTLGAVILGALLGIVFGASSLYLVLKVGLTVSASIPVAVLSITLFRVLARVLRIRRATILENNIVQTTGSAGESIAFGVGVTIPALMLLGFDMDIVRIMTVGVLGGLLGILMMIPLRRAFIVKQHGKLLYPEGTACADVLIVGEKGGATAKTVFAGFGLAFVYKFLMDGLNVCKDTLNIPLFTSSGKGLKGGVLGGELAPELVGVGYIIGPRISSTMLAGGVLAYLVMVPAIVFFSGNQSKPLFPEKTKLVQQMSTKEIRDKYVLYIGAGAVATGGLISMLQSLPLIFRSVRAGIGDMRSAIRPGRETPVQLPRIDQDLPMKVVLFGSIGLVIALASAPRLGLGLSVEGISGACLIVVFGFLFVTVSSRLTGEIGSSSNPISGMTVATLLFTCLAFVVLGRTGHAATLAAITVAAVVCVAASNAGTTAQDLKTGYLVGATPRRQQYAILIGALTSALVIGVTLLLLNRAGTVYTRASDNLPKYQIPAAQVTGVNEQERSSLLKCSFNLWPVEFLGGLTERSRVGDGYEETDSNQYHVLHVRDGQFEAVPAGTYLVDDQGRIQFVIDPPGGKINARDDGQPRGEPIYTRKPEFLPSYKVSDLADLPAHVHVGGEYAASDSKEYSVLIAKDGKPEGVPSGKYLVDETGQMRYYVAYASDARIKTRDDGRPRGETIYAKNPDYLPKYLLPNSESLKDLLKETARAEGDYAGKDATEYHVLQAREGDFDGVAQGKYLVDDQRRIQYLIDPAINGRVDKRDNGVVVLTKFEAPKAQLMALIVDGILNQKLPWGLVLLGVLIALTVELMGMPSLPFAVGVYLPIQTSVPIFVGGALRWLVNRKSKQAADSEMSPGSLLSTGYIAGGTIGGVVVAFLEFLPPWIKKYQNVGAYLGGFSKSDWTSAVAFALLVVVLLVVAGMKVSPAGASADDSVAK